MANIGIGFLSFLPVLLKYNWHTVLYKFKCIAQWFDLHTSWNDYQSKVRDYSSSYRESEKWSLSVLSDSVTPWTVAYQAYIDTKLNK